MEIKILEWINANLHGSHFVNFVMKCISYLAEWGWCWLVLGVVLLCFKRTRKSGFILICGYGAVVLINHFILKNVINRARPFTQNSALAEFIQSIGMSLPMSSSFPSGHTVVSFCSAVILTYYFKGKGAWAFLPATLIAISRVFLCLHYPTDVLGGMMIGIIIGIITLLCGKLLFYIIDKIKSKQTKKEID